MSLFPLSLKLYHFWDKDEVKIGIRCSDVQVYSFYFKAEKFQRMLLNCYENGYDEEGYFVLVKKDYVRFSKQLKEAGLHLRVSPEKWKKMISIYNEKLKTRDGEFFSVEVE